MKVLYHISVFIPSKSKGPMDEAGTITPYLSSQFSSRNGDIQGSGNDDEFAARATMEAILTTLRGSFLLSDLTFAGNSIHLLQQCLAGDNKKVLIEVSAMKTSVINPGSFVTLFKKGINASLVSMIPQDQGYEVNFDLGNVASVSDSTPALNEDEMKAVAKRFKEASDKIVMALVVARLQAWMAKNNRWWERMKDN